MPDPAAKPPAKPNLFQKIAGFFKDAAAWVEETFSDPEIAKQVREDLGQNSDNPATPTPVSADTAQKIDTFLAKEDVDKAAFLQTVAEIKNVADVIMTFADTVKADGVSAADVFWLIFKVFGAESLRLRNPSAYALAALAGLVLEDDELIAQLDPAPLTRMLKGEASSADADVLVDRISAAGGALVVLADQLSKTVGGTIDAMYGWDPEPGTPPEAAAAASRALSVVFRTGTPVDPVLTLVPVPTSDGGPGLLISVSAHLKVEHDTGSVTYTADIGANGAFALYFRFSTENPDFRALGPGDPSIDIAVRPTETDQGTPALVCGTTDGTRLELGSLTYGVLVGADAAGFKLHAEKGKLVITTADGDGFVKKLPGKEIQVPFNLGLIADTAHGVRFDGGSGLKVNLPVAASVLGVFTIQFVALELKLAADPSVEIRGAFSVKLGPFQATVDQIGTAISFAPLRNGLQQADSLDDLVTFLPPKGIGLALDAGAIKGGGYLYIDPDRGEYAGALELKLLTFSVKAIALLSTKRPDGSPGWSLLLFIFAQFKVHIAFGIFWTGLGGMIGLHHRSDLDALTAGMKTGALDDILFPANPVADAPRIIGRYRQLFPIEEDSLLFGPMLELAFSEPAIVYVRLGLIFELKNALGSDKPVELTKVILLGQLLAQLPPRSTGAPAIVKLLVDVVGFYDAPAKFLLIRARLRDSFAGVEHFAKLDLTGELVLAMRFGDDASFVLSAGGFHPAFKDVPQGVPSGLERLAVSFGINIIKLRAELYFAITSNSVQTGCKFELSADIDVAAIKGHLSFDALLYLSPKFYFIVELDFQVSLEAFGESLASVTVHMALEGPGEWHAKGNFSFSILWWDVDIGFDERWGRTPVVETEQISAITAVTRELSNRDHLMPGPPVGGNALVTLAQNPAGTSLAHPLSVITVAQKAIPFDVDIDRIGTRRLSEGKAHFTVDDVRVGGESLQGRWEPVADHFARGQFMELTEQQKLDGRSVETFTAGVRIGTTNYAVSTVGSTVVADYEVAVLEPAAGLNMHWKVTGRFTEAMDYGLASALSVHGAAASSARSVAQRLVPNVGKASVSEVPLAIVDATTLVEQSSVTAGPRSSDAIATQTATARGAIVVEAFEVGHA